MSTLFTDDFNRADSAWGALGSNWGEFQYSGCLSRYKILSNGLTSYNAGSYNPIIYVGGVTVPNDVWAEIKYISDPISYPNNSVYVAVRVTDNNSSLGYMLQVLGDGRWFLYAPNPTDGWLELASGTTTVSYGDIFRVEASGSNIKCYQNSNLLGSGVDSTYSSGYIAICCDGPDGGLSSAIDDFAFGDVPPDTTPSIDATVAFE